MTGSIVDFPLIRSSGSHQSGFCLILVGLLPHLLLLDLCYVGGLPGGIHDNTHKRALIFPNHS